MGDGGWAVGRWGTGDWGRVFIARRRRWRRRSHACQQINHARNAIKYKKIIQSSPQRSNIQQSSKQQQQQQTHTHSHICTKINARKPPTQKSCPQGVCVMLQQAKDSKVYASVRLCVCQCVYVCVIVSLFL